MDTEEQPKVEAQDPENIESSSEDPEQLLEEINARLQEAEADNLTEELLEESVAGIKHCLELDPDFNEARFVYVYGHLNKYDEALQELEAIRASGGEDDRWRVMKQELENMMYDMEEEEVQTNLPQVEKLLENGGVSEKFVNALTEIFQRFDSDKDGSLSNSELNDFHMVVNGSPIEESTIDFLLTNCESDDKGLTLNGFIGFYVAQTAGDPDETWKDLGNLGYDRELNKF